MSSEDRLAKKEFRKRGPGKRNVQADTLEIVTKSSRNTVRERELNNLKSAFVKNEDIDNLPSVRRRTLGANENAIKLSNLNINPNIGESTITHNIDSRKPFSNYDTDLYEETHSGFGDEFDQGGIIGETYSPEFDSTQKYAQELTQESSEKPAKRGRGRPRKIKIEDPSAPPKIKRKVGRPRKGTEVNATEKKINDIPRRSTRMANRETTSYKIDKSKQRTTKLRPISTEKQKRLESVYHNKKPIPLSKTKSNETQKPMYINTERIITSDNRDKRLRVNTLDVLKHLVENFNPTITHSTFVNENLIHNEFKNHVLHHMGYLFDAHANMNDILQRINDIQKKKSQLRNRIFELKKNHANIGSELSRMRSNYQDERLKFRSFSKMTNKLQSLSNIVNDPEFFDSSESNEENTKSNNEAIDKNIFTFSKVINPNSGMFKKLVLINNRLSKIDNELSY